MSKKKELQEEKVYFSINAKPRMLFELEKITVVGDKVVKTETDDPTYLQIVLGNIYKESAIKVNS